MSLLDLLRSPEKLGEVSPEMAADLLGEVTALGEKLKMRREHSNGNTGHSGDMLTSEEVAKILKVKTHFVAERARRGEIKSKKFGRYVRFHPEDVEAYKKSNR